MPARDTQQKILDFIVNYIEKVGMSPTQREIAQAMEFASMATVDRRLAMLEETGFILRYRGAIRGITLLNPKLSRDITPSEKRLGIPVVGSIAAGMPLDISPEPVAYVGLDQDLAYDKPYALLVKSRSMIEDHICPGDYVIVKPQSHCQNGDTIVAVHLSNDGAGSATLKRFFREEHRVRLEPANSELSPILIPEGQWDSEWQVQSKVIAIFRDYGEDSWVNSQEDVSKPDIKDSNRVQHIPGASLSLTSSLKITVGKSNPFSTTQEESVENVNPFSTKGISELKPFAIARTTLEENDQALIGKTYFVQAGISQNKAEGFSSEPFRLSVHSSAESIEFDILLHASENIELSTEWYQRLLYRVDNPKPQLVEFAFRPLAPGHGSLTINFYRERHWLKAIHFEFDAVEQLRTVATSLKR